MVLLKEKQDRNKKNDIKHSGGIRFNSLKFPEKILSDTPRELGFSRFYAV